jgi:hypothetical protein
MDIWVDDGDKSCCKLCKEFDVVTTAFWVVTPCSFAILAPTFQSNLLRASSG